MASAYVAFTGFDRADVSLSTVEARFAVQHLDIPKIGALEENPPAALVIDWRQPETRELCQAVRMSSRLVDLPILAIVDDDWSVLVARAFRRGVDEYLSISQLDRLPHALGVAVAGNERTPAAASGCVVLADPDRDRRVQLARYLRRMGLEIRFAIDAEGIDKQQNTRLIVAHCDLALEDIVPSVIDEKLAPRWLIAGDRTGLMALSNRLKELEHVGLFDIDSDPSQIVFGANQVLMPSLKSKRQSARIPFGVPISVTISGSRPAEQRAKTVYGYTYNLSQGGLYVRSLTPPPMGVEVAVEFSPPYGRGRVRIDGKVVWRLAQMGGRGGTPCGFGVEYSRIDLADSAALEAGYARLVKDNDYRDHSEAG